MPAGARPIQEVVAAQVTRRILPSPALHRVSSSNAHPRPVGGRDGLRAGVPLTHRSSAIAVHWMAAVSSPAAGERRATAAESSGVGPVSTLSPREGTLHRAPRRVEALWIGESATADSPSPWG